MRIVRHIGSDRGRFEELWRLFRDGQPPLPQRASWVLRYVCEANPALRQENVQRMTDAFVGELGHPAEMRTLAQVLALCKLNEDQMGQLVDVCLARVRSAAIPVASRVFSMEILFQIAQAIPELAGEIALTIEGGMETGTGGYRSRGRKILRKLNKMS